MQSLTVPPAAQRDNNSVQMLGAWIAENGLHCALKVGVWHDQERSEASAWGILLADVVRHLSNAIRDEYGTDPSETTNAVVKSLLAELDEPSSNAHGEFHPGHS